MKKYSNLISNYFVNLNYDTIPNSVVDKIKNTLLDSIGMILSGVAYSNEHNDYNVLNYIKKINDREEATVFGYGCKSSTRLSAFANGCMIELLDWQDSTIKARIHGSSAIVPAVLSVGEFLNSSGKDIITSLITGYEISTRIGISVQPSHWRNGFQATGTVNTIGVAAAISKLKLFYLVLMANNLRLDAMVF